MNRRAVTRLAACLVGSAAMFGCRTTDTHNAAVVPPVASSTPGGASERQLSPRKTAVACLATAKEMEKAEQFEPAIQLYERARSNDPSLTGQVSRRLAVIYDQRGEFDKSRQEYERALKLTPKDAELHNNLGYSCYCQGKLDEAQRHLRKALDLAPSNPRAWNNMGLALAMQEKYDESLAAFKKVVSPAQAHCNLGFMLAAHGKRDLAMENYTKALELDHNLNIARVALARLSDPGFGATQTSANVAPAQPAPETIRQAAVQLPTQTTVTPPN